MDNKGIAYRVIRDIQAITPKEKTYIDWDELTNIALATLDKAEKNYNPNIKRATFSTYAYKAIKYEIIIALGFYKHTQDTSDIDCFYSIASPDTDIKLDSSIDFEIIYKNIIKDISKLNINYSTKRILAMYIYGYTVEDIAEYLNCNKQKVYSLISKHKQALRDIVRRYTDAYRK